MTNENCAVTLVGGSQILLELLPMSGQSPPTAMPSFARAGEFNEPTEVASAPWGQILGHLGTADDASAACFEGRRTHDLRYLNAARSWETLATAFHLSADGGVTGVGLRLNPGGGSRVCGYYANLRWRTPVIELQPPQLPHWFSIGTRICGNHVIGLSYQMVLTRGLGRRVGCVWDMTGRLLETACDPRDELANYRLIVDRSSDGWTVGHVFRPTMAGYPFAPGTPFLKAPHTEDTILLLADTDHEFGAAKFHPRYLLSDHAVICGLESKRGEWLLAKIRLL